MQRKTKDDKLVHPGFLFSNSWIVLHCYLCLYCKLSKVPSGEMMSEDIADKDTFESVLVYLDIQLYLFEQYNGMQWHLKGNRIASC